MRWSVLTGGARFALQLIAQVLLARQLGPQAFGLFAMGLVAITLAGFVAGFGLSWSLMQRAKLDDEDIRFAWTGQLLAGMAALLLLQLLAPSVAAAFREPAAEPVIRWLSISCLLQAADRCPGRPARKPAGPAPPAASLPAPARTRPTPAG